MQGCPISFIVEVQLTFPVLVSKFPTISSFQEVNHRFHTVTFDGNEATVHYRRFNRQINPLLMCFEFF